MSDLELIERLSLAALLGGVIGFEREWRQKNAGLKTNILIAMGSALFTLMSIDLSISSGGDPTRVAAQIVTGIGFLGAGAIMRTGSGIRGLTTAATIWVNAAIGMACGGGEYRLAIISTGVTVIVLILMTPFEKVLDRHLKRRRGRNTGDDDDDDPDETADAPSADRGGGPVMAAPGSLPPAAPR